MIARRTDLNQILGAMDLFRTRMNSVFNDFDRNYLTSARLETGENYPRTNLFDTGDNLEVVVELPGIAKEDMNVKIQGNYLEISGTCKANIPEGYTIHRKERGASTFSRSFTLPYDVDANRVTATLKDGLLKMTLPKSESAKPKQIEIG